MPMQQQMSSFAKKLGGRVSAANAEHKDKPVDTGNRRLPAGIRNGIAKLSSMYTKEYADDTNGPGTKGQVFFRASAIVMAPESVNGEKVAGMVTQVIIPICDMPAKGLRKAVSLKDNWYEFQNLFKLLRIMPPNEDEKTDPTGQRTEAYYFAAMKTLTDPTRPPVYITFSTRGWTPPSSAMQPKPNELVFETWHGLADESVVASLNGQHDPGAGVRETSTNAAAVQPEPFQEPPQGQVEYPPPHGRGRTIETVNNTDVDDTSSEQTDVADEVTALVEVAMDDPEGATKEGQAAAARLEQLARANGWTKEETVKADDWFAVGEMAINPPEELSSDDTPAVGSKWKFAKRDKNGARLKNGKGEDFPAQDVEVVTVDEVAQTCTVKSTRDGRDVVDIRSKKPVIVKWEWLEPV